MPLESELAPERDGAGRQETSGTDQPLPTFPDLRYLPDSVALAVHNGKSDVVIRGGQALCER